MDNITIKTSAHYLEEVFYSSTTTSLMLNSGLLMGGYILKPISTLTSDETLQRLSNALIANSKLLLVAMPVLGFSIVVTSKAIKKLPDSFTEQIDYLAYC